MRRIFACCCLSKPTSAKKKPEKNLPLLFTPHSLCPLPNALYPPSSRALLPLLSVPSQRPVPASAAAQAQMPIRLTALECVTLGSERLQQPSVAAFLRSFFYLPYSNTCPGWMSSHAQGFFSSSGSSLSASCFVFRLPKGMKAQHCVFSSFLTAIDC